MIEPGKIKTCWLALAGGIWLATAILFGVSKYAGRLQPPGPQIILLAVTAFLLISSFALPSVRSWWRAIDVRILIALHLSRFVGIYFLILNANGELPDFFAIPAGYGDVVVATLALFLLIGCNPSTPWGRSAYLAWNVAGTIDILGVIVVAAVQGMAQPESMRALTHLPLCLLPTFLVPLIVTSHVLLFVRLMPIPQRIP